MPERVFALGNPSWEAKAKAKENRDRLRAIGRKRFGVAEGDIMVLYAVTNDLDDATLDDPGHVEYFDGSERGPLLEFLLAVQDAKRNGGRVSGVIRQKPGLNDAAVFISKEIELLCPSVQFDVERTFDGEAASNCTLCAADVVVGFDTLAVSDAAMLGIPAMYYVPNLKTSGKGDPQFAFNESRITVPFHEPNMLRNLILDIGCDPKVLSRLRSSIVPNAAENIADKLVELFGK